MPVHQKSPSQVARDTLHKRALAQGWIFQQNPFGGTYRNPTTGQTTATPPLPSGWRTVDIGRVGKRYVGAGGEIQSIMPTSPSVAVPTAAESATPDDKPTGSAKPRPVVSAKGLLNGDTDRPLVASGGKPILTTPFGICLLYTSPSPRD